MTIDEFFAALEKTPRDWGIDWGIDWERSDWERTAVRRNGTFSYQCPLTAVAGFGEREGYWTHAHPGHWADAARELRLTIKDARKIVKAADGHGSLRARLLAACGLKQ